MQIQIEAANQRDVLCYPSIIYTAYTLGGHGGAGADPSWHLVRDRVHLGQVSSQSQGKFYAILSELNFHTFNFLIRYNIKLGFYSIIAPRVEGSHL